MYTDVESSKKNTSDPPLFIFTAIYVLVMYTNADTALANEQEKNTHETHGTGILFSHESGQ